MAAESSVRGAYEEAVGFLQDLRWFGARFGLEDVRRLANESGNPEKRLRFIHVAGTNGKGSTCAMLESVYRAAGLRVGLFTSPHLVCFRERIQVNREWIGEAEVVRRVNELRPLLRAFPKESHPTFFEVLTVLALKFFADERCDLVIWETGLGGRLDATNIVTPLASVITNVQFDHEQWLGATLAQIAREKAGIIKPGVPVLTMADAPEALCEIRETARRASAPLTVLDPRAAVDPLLAELELPLAGPHQRINALLALATVRALRPGLPVSDAAIGRGLCSVKWPGRMEVVRRSGGRTIVLDGAHNPAGAETLRVTLEQGFPACRPALVLGFLADKDWGRMARILLPSAERTVVVPVHSERGAEPGVVAGALRALGFQVETAPGLAEALARLSSAPLVVIAGSLYLVGEAEELLHGAVPAAGEGRMLNEWLVPGPKA